MQFWTNTRGNVAIVFALVMPCLLVCMALAVDYAVWINQKQELQRIADQAALTAASELYMANTSGSQAEAVAKSSATDSMLSAGMMTTSDSTGGTDPAAPTSESPGSSNNSTTFGGAVSLDTNVDMSEGSVEVIVTQAGVGFFSPMFMAPPVIRVSSVARAMGGGRICVISLDDTADEALSMMNSANLTAQQCGVYSNSTSSAGIRLGGTTHIDAELTCSAGGVDATSSHFEVEPVTDCPKIADPLAGRAAPTYGGCDYTDTKITTQNITISPGVYCGGLTIQSGSQVFLNSGIYIMKDGPLTVGSNSAVEGENVGFYFEGDTSTFAFVSSASVSFTAPKDGPLAGILFFEARNSPPLREFKILSDNARMLLGTFYLPAGILKVSTNTPVADQSAYTAIIARQLQLQQSPNLVLNADYNQTDVPVPAGLGTSAVGRTVILTR